MKKDKPVYTCRVCGFTTLSKDDIIKHLSWKEKYEEENCDKKIIEIK